MVRRAACRGGRSWRLGCPRRPRGCPAAPPPAPRRASSWRGPAPTRHAGQHTRGSGVRGEQGCVFVWPAHQLEVTRDEGDLVLAGQNARRPEVWAALGRCAGRRLGGGGERTDRTRDSDPPRAEGRKLKPPRRAKPLAPRPRRPTHLCSRRVSQSCSQYSESGFAFVWLHLRALVSGLCV